MIDIVFCLKRRPELSAEEFGLYWLEQHAPLVESHAETLGILRYSQHHTIDTPLTDVLRVGRGCAREHFDGMALISFDSLDALQADLERSVIWFTDHEPVRG